jgi:aquaporin Z
MGDARQEIKNPVLRVHDDSCKCFAEFTGTFFLVLTVGMNVLTGSVGAAISIGGILAVMIFALGSVSGAHFNPAVTVAILLSGRNFMEPLLAVFYILSQLLGGLLAAMTYSLICDATFTLSPVGKHTWHTALIVECLYSMALCYVVLNVATTRRQLGNQYFGLAIGFTVVGAALAIGGISGCSVNPAVSFGTMVVAAFANGTSALTYFPLYFFTPFLGAGLAFGAFYVVRKGEEYKWHSFEPS